MVKDIKTAIVGGVVGVGILLTVFCCEGNKEAPVVEEVIESTPAVEEVVPAVEEVLPAESVE